MKGFATRLAWTIVFPLVLLGCWLLWLIAGRERTNHILERVKRRQE